MKNLLFILIFLLSPIFGISSNFSKNTDTTVIRKIRDIESNIKSMVIQGNVSFIEENLSECITMFLIMEEKTLEGELTKEEVSKFFNKLLINFPVTYFLLAKEEKENNELIFNLKYRSLDENSDEFTDFNILFYIKDNKIHTIIFL